MKISIITATKNNKAGLMRAIESVRSQTYKNVEHIIVDGLSTDGTAEVIYNLQFTINNDASSRTNVGDLKISLPIDRDRNDKDQQDRPFDGVYPDSIGAQGDKSLVTDHYSLITISEADSGIYDAINKGIKLATGDVIGLLHSDDFYADKFVLEIVGEVFEQRAEGQAQRPLDGLYPDSIGAQGVNRPPTTAHPPPTIDAVYSDLVYVRSEKREVRSKNGNSASIDHSALKIEHSVIRTWKTHKTVSSEQILRQAQDDEQITYHYSPLTTHHMLSGWMPPHPTLFIRKEIFDKYGLYRTDMKIAADYEMILRLFWKYKITTHYLPLTTYCMSIGGASNKSLKNIFIKSSEDYRAMKIHSLPFPLKTLILKNLSKIPQFFHSNK